MAASQPRTFDREIGLQTSTSDQLVQPRLSLRQQAPSMYLGLVPEEGNSGDSRADGSETRENDAACTRESDLDANISISSHSKEAGQTVAPFLAKHIPDQYAPQGLSLQPSGGESNTKYCYRHRPDLKCRRQADEPSMDQLQTELDSLSNNDQKAISHLWSLFSAAPAKHRNLMLRGILAQCCFPQLSYLSASVRDLIRIDFLTALPPEISFKILCYLDTASLCKAAQVSQRWRMLADDDVVWHKMCEQHIDRKCVKCGWGLPLLERNRLRAMKREIQLRARGRGLNVWSPDITPQPEYNLIDNHPNSTVVSQDLAALNGARKRGMDALCDSTTASTENAKRVCTFPSKAEQGDSYFQPRFRPWKDVYKDRFKIGSNWRYGRYSMKSFKGHTNGIMCLQFDDRMLATGSYDNNIKIWNIETGEEIRTLRGHEQGVRALQFDDTKLISGSMDRSIKVWNWRTGECISTYTGHTGGVLSLHFDSTILASGSIDGTIKIWNFCDKSTFLLRGHTDWVNAVKVDTASRTVFSASDDCTARLWDLDSRACIKVFEGHVGQVQQVQPLPPEFEYEAMDMDQDGNGAVRVLPGVENTDPASRGNSPRQANPTPWGADRAKPPQYFLTGALDNTICLWETATGKCLRTYFGHVEGVWALAADTLRIVSGSEDRTVKVWDTRTGKCDTFTGHVGPVTCIALSDSRMCTGSEDGEARLYSFKSNDRSVVLAGENGNDSIHASVEG